MLEGHAFPATHVAVVGQGADVISSFVFDDGTTQARGVAVVMTPAAVRTTLDMLQGLQQQAQTLANNDDSAMVSPREYVLEREPVSVHAVSAVFAEDSELAVLGFRSIDFAETFPSLKSGRGPIVSKLTLVVALSAPKVLGWMGALRGAAESMGGQRQGKSRRRGRENVDARQDDHRPAEVSRTSKY